MNESESPLVGVVVITWNQCNDTLECLTSIFRMAYPRLFVVLVDNASTDGTGAAVATQFPQVECITNQTNRGFAAAVNQGIERAIKRDAEYLFVLNNDTVVDSMALHHLMQYATDDAVGMLVPKIYYFAQPQMIWSVGAGLNGLTFETRGDIRGVEDNGQWESVVERKHVTACALLLPRRVVEKIGVLDERFFYYYDDADFSLRVHEAGYRTLLVPQAKVWHKVAQASGGVDTPYQRYWMGRSSVLYFRKHVHSWRWLIVGPYRLGSAIKTTIRLLAHRRLAAIKAYWHGLYDGLMVK
jgi:GT2 family glycosyltransferase